MDPQEGAVGIIGRMLTSDGQQFVMVGKQCIVIGQTVVCTDFRILLFFEHLMVITTSQVPSCQENTKVSRT